MGKIIQRSSLIAAFAAGSFVPLPVPGQITILGSDLPATVGDYSRAYIATASVNVSTLIGPPGGPQRWDFSKLLLSDEVRHRFEIVSLANDPNRGSYPDAHYAERLTREPDTIRSHSYYAISAEGGRSYYGFHQAGKAPVVFLSPTVDLPAPIQYGRTWKRTVNFEDVLDTGLIPLRVAITFTSEAKVDAYGTIILPRIGAVPALRLNEANTYVLRDMLLGFPLQAQYFRTYTWLVRGVGIAAQIIAKGENETPPERFGTANTVLRVFEANNVPDRLRLPVSGLRIARDDSKLILQWMTEPAPARYRIEAAADIALPAWTFLAELGTNVWSEPLLDEFKQRFYRVLVEP